MIFVIYEPIIHVYFFLYEYDIFVIQFWSIFMSISHITQ